MQEQRDLSSNHNPQPHTREQIQTRPALEIARQYVAADPLPFDLLRQPIPDSQQRSPPEARSSSLPPRTRDQPPFQLTRPFTTANFPPGCSHIAATDLREGRRPQAERSFSLPPVGEVDETIHLEDIRPPMRFPRPFTTVNTASGHLRMPRPQEGSRLRAERSFSMPPLGEEQESASAGNFQHSMSLSRPFTAANTARHLHMPTPRPREGSRLRTERSFSMPPPGDPEQEQAGGSMQSQMFNSRRGTENPASRCMLFTPADPDVHPGVAELMKGMLDEMRQMKTTLDARMEAMNDSSHTRRGTSASTLGRFRSPRRPNQQRTVEYQRLLVGNFIPMMSMLRIQLILYLDQSK